MAWNASGHDAPPHLPRGEFQVQQILGSLLIVLNEVYMVFVG